MRDRDDVVAMVQRRSPCWTRGKEEMKDSPATPDESLYGGFWRLKGGGSKKQKVEYHPPFFRVLLLLGLLPLHVQQMDGTNH